MTAREANDKGYRIGNHSFEEDGYEVTYPDGYKSWSPAKEFEKAYYKLEDHTGDVLKENDIKRFIKGIENVKVGTKTTNTTLTCLTGFKEVNSINANGLYVILKAGSNRAGFIKFDD